MCNTSEALYIQLSWVGALPHSIAGWSVLPHTLQITPRSHSEWTRITNLMATNTSCHFFSCVYV